jgi:hypothetical protein
MVLKVSDSMTSSFTTHLSRILSLCLFFQASTLSCYSAIFRSEDFDERGNFKKESGQTQTKVSSKNLDETGNSKKNIQNKDEAQTKILNTLETLNLLSCKKDFKLQKERALELITNINEQLFSLLSEQKKAPNVHALEKLVQSIYETYKKVHMTFFPEILKLNSKQIHNQYLLYQKLNSPEFLPEKKVVFEDSYPPYERALWCSWYDSDLDVEHKKTLFTYLYDKKKLGKVEFFSSSLNNPIILGEALWTFWQLSQYVDYAEGIEENQTNYVMYLQEKLMGAYYCDVGLFTRFFLNHYNRLLALAIAARLKSEEKYQNFTTGQKKN